MTDPTPNACSHPRPPGPEGLRIAFLGMRSLGHCAGGVETHVRELATRMAAQGNQVTAYCRSAYAADADSPPGVRVVSLPAVNTKHLEAISHTALAVPCTAFGYDIVHIHAIGPSLLSWAPRLAGRKVVVTVHGLDFLRKKWGRAASLVLRAGAWTAGHCPHATIVVSPMLQEYYRNRYGVEARYIPNGVAPPIRRPINLLARFGVRGGDYVLYLGRLVPEKGAHHLIRAFRTLDWEGRLLVVGGTPHAEDYARHLRDLAAGDPRIAFTGPLYGEAKDEAFSNARLFVLPSELEGMPIALLEAMSFGCPSLASDIPECVELCRPRPAPADDAQPGPPLALTFAAGSSQALAESLREALARNDLAALGLAAQDHVLKEYDWDGVTSSTLGVYADILARK